MRYAISAILLLVGLVNFFPVIGVLSAERLHQLYGLQLESADLILLMRHRAVLFGLLGGFVLISAFRPALQPLACGAGLTSMIAFVLLAYSVGDYGPALSKVVNIDIAASIGLLVVLILRWHSARADS